MKINDISFRKDKNKYFICDYCEMSKENLVTFSKTKKNKLRFCAECLNKLTKIINQHIVELESK